MFSTDYRWLSALDVKGNLAVLLSRDTSERMADAAPLGPLQFISQPSDSLYVWTAPFCIVSSISWQQVGIF